MVTRRKSKLEVIRFRYDVPLKETMAFESVYHKNLQYDFKEKKELREVPGGIFVWMLIDGELVGESYGIPLAHLHEPVEGLDKLSRKQRRVGIYCYSNTILPRFQQRGFGTILKAHWLGVAAGTGFGVVFGHARPGPSLAVNIKFGAVVLKTFANWYETGEAYRLYRIVLNGL